MEEISNDSDSSQGNTDALFYCLTEKKFYIVAKSRELPKTSGKNIRQNSSGIRVKNELYKNIEETNKNKLMGVL